ncbi:MAG: hypothetical protein K0B37_10875 [Bacteroidales bacterium]|nr:hypothetical protein [Bacteroidales bacterium]
MKIILIILAIVIITILFYYFYKIRLGQSVGNHLFLFETEYDSLIFRYPPEVALNRAFDVFKTCPHLRNLSPSEIDKALRILGNAYDPKAAIRNIILLTTAAKALQAFRNSDFLEEYVKTFNKS